MINVLVAGPGELKW